MLYDFIYIISNRHYIINSGHGYGRICNYITYIRHNRIYSNYSIDR